MLQHVCVCFMSMVSYLCVYVSDCPQVQCVEQYIAQQADELTLEPTEIINVIRKTNEGKNMERVPDLSVTGQKRSLHTGL